MRTNRGIFLLGLGLLGAAGCAAPAPPTGPTMTRVELSDRDAALDEMMTVLRELELPPRYIDRQRGVILAGPTTSAQWFEFWRQDARGPYQWAESSLATVQREITVTVEPVDDVARAAVAATQPGDGPPAAGEYELRVTVEKQRYSAPERQLTTAAGALAIYSERLPTTEGLRAAKSYGEHWVPLGRDALLEEYLLARLVARAGDRVVE